MLHLINTNQIKFPDISVDQGDHEKIFYKISKGVAGILQLYYTWPFTSLKDNLQIVILINLAPMDHHHKILGYSI